MDNRCNWVGNHQIMIDYHDSEWGVPVYDDHKLFEYMVLDTFQAGLSWLIILKKREALRRAFHNFSPKEVATFSEKEITLLLSNPDIIRNKLKVEGTIINARKFLEVAGRFGSFSNFIWNFVDGKPIINHWKDLKEIPSKSELSDKISKELKSFGFKFVGSTIIYAFLQAAGIVNDHLESCFRYKEIIAKYRI